MIDLCATAGTFADKHQLAVDLATAVKTIEELPDIPMFRKNTAVFTILRQGANEERVAAARAEIGRLQAGQ